jgi:hypothetical protein
MPAIVEHLDFVPSGQPKHVSEMMDLACIGEPDPISVT